MAINVPIDEFCKALQRHAEHKAQLYDGVNSQHSLDHLVLFATEELGEVATAVVRERYHNVVVECIDLAHTAMLIALKLDPDGEILKRQANR